MSSELFTTEREWPARLLHVQGNQFQSHQRQGSHTYGGVDNPQYNILSYTWGRWETSKGKALPITGTTWEVPIVDKRGFSVEAFAKVVQHVKQDGSFVWLDIACIDQENERVKATEIGKQAAIFRGARQAYIWLSHSKRSALKPFILKALSRDALEINRPWLDRLAKGVEQIFSDPWFSSLWTLQEGYLRRDAILLFDDASWLDIPKFESYSQHGGPCTLLDITSAYSHIYSEVLGVLRLDPDRLGHDGNRRAREVCQRLDDVGVPCIAKSHAIALYGVSSLRNPMREADRIYGIMQVFGLVLGKSAQPNKNFTLTDLEDQLGAALNRANPVLAQSFVHLTDPRHNRRWCLQRRMRVFSNSPVMGRELDQPTPCCQIIFAPAQSHGLAVFQGHKARLGDLIMRLKANRASFQTIQFDNTSENRQALPEAFLHRETRLEPHIEEVLETVKMSYGQEASVLVIGGLEEHQIRRWLGVVAYRSPKLGHGGRECWARVGVCTWLMETGFLWRNLGDILQENTIYLA